MFASVDDVERFREHDVRFHQHLARASGNPMLAAFVDMVAGFSVGRRSRSGRGDDLRAKATHHRNIYLAVRARNADLARTAMNQHLPSPAERIPAARAV
jgi:GntR family transcriptional repressor for pyruvate dehydrogenase complex